MTDERDGQGTISRMTPPTGEPEADEQGYITFTREQFEARIAKLGEDSPDRLIVVVFGHQNCGDCRRLKGSPETPGLLDLLANYDPSQLEILKVNSITMTEEGPEALFSPGEMFGVPLVRFYRGGVQLGLQINYETLPNKGTVGFRNAVLDRVENYIPPQAGVTPVRRT